MASKRKGTRCKVCVFCGACFQDDANEGVSSASTWSGVRCDVCKGCGKCLKAWGLLGVDAESGATSWADAFKGMDDGSRGAAPAFPAPPGESHVGTPAHQTQAQAHANGQSVAKAQPEAAMPAQTQLQGGRARSPFATLKANEGEVDTSTGATPGVSSACKEFGMGDSLVFAASLGIKPPGQA